MMRPGKSDQEEIRGFAKRIVTIIEMIQTLGEIPKPVHVKELSQSRHIIPHLELMANQRNS